MQITAQQAIKEVNSGKHQPIYCLVGDEAFQISEFKTKLKGHFLKGDSKDYNFEEAFGEGLDVAAFISVLQTLPGLFDDGASRLVFLNRFERVAPSSIEALLKYFENPNPSTCLLIHAQKADKRQKWVKALQKSAGWIEVREPYEREWAKWRTYFERKSKKQIDSVAWERLLMVSNRSLSTLWAEIQKMATYVGERPSIQAEDVSAFGSGSPNDNVFTFAEAVVERKRGETLERYVRLRRSGEADVKLLAIVLRQFRLVRLYRRLTSQGVLDNRTLASQLGIPGYFLSKFAQQASRHTTRSLDDAMTLLSECDYRIKTGAGRLFENFLVPYFQMPSS